MVLLNRFLDRSLTWHGISFHNFTPSREKEYFCVFSLELFTYDNDHLPLDLVMQASVVIYT